MKPRPSPPNHRRRPKGKERGGDGAALSSPCFPDHRRIASATVGDGGDGLARTWLVLWPEIEPTPRKYQEPVPLERVLADHRAALAALPISEGMDTSATPIEAPAGCSQAGEAGIVGPQKEARHTGSLDLGDRLNFAFFRLIIHRTYKCHQQARDSALNLPAWMDEPV